MSGLTMGRLRQLVTAPPSDEVIGTKGEVLPAMYRHVMRVVRQVVKDPEKQAQVELAIRERMDWLDSLEEPTPLEKAYQRLESALAAAKMDVTGETSTDMILLELLRVQLNSGHKPTAHKAAGKIVTTLDRIFARYNRVDWEEIQAARDEVERLQSQANSDR